MGGSSSSRKITLEHDDTNGVIKISDTVVKRLRGELSQDAGKNSDRSSAKSQNEDQHFKPNDGPPLTAPQAAQSWRQSAASYEEQRIQNLRNNQERDAEIKAMEQKWRAKLAAAEEQNSEVQRKMGAEFTDAVNKVESLFPSTTCDPICLEKQNRVLRCYQANEKQSLNCSKDVRDFTNCVQQARLDTLIKG